MSNIAAPESGCKPSGILSPTMQANHARLCELIRAAQVASPHEHVGQIWAKPISLQAWCDIGGFALRTLKELIKYPPIRRYQCNLPGGKVTLLRVGDPGPEQDKVLAKQMAAYFLAATKEETVSRNEFGMLCGLAHDWPDGWQVEIFKHAIIHWPDFMDDVKVEVEIALAVLGRGDDPFHPEALADPLYATARRYCGRGDKLSRFSADLEPIFFEQLTSERRVVKYLKGQPLRRFERIPGKRAETLDSTCYALAARQLIGMNLDRREEELASVTMPKKPPAVIKSAWLNR